MRGHGARSAWAQPKYRFLLFWCRATSQATNHLSPTCISRDSTHPVNDEWLSALLDSSTFSSLFHHQHHQAPIRLICLSHRRSSSVSSGGLARHALPGRKRLALTHYRASAEGEKLAQCHSTLPVCMRLRDCSHCASFTDIY